MSEPSTEIHLKNKIDETIKQFAGKLVKFCDDDSLDAIIGEKNDAIVALMNRIKRLEIENANLKITADESKSLVALEITKTRRSERARKVLQKHRDELAKLLISDHNEPHEIPFNTLLKVDSIIKHTLLDDLQDKKIKRYTMELWYNHTVPVDNDGFKGRDFDQSWPSMPLVHGPFGYYVTGQELGVTITLPKLGAPIVFGELAPGWNKILCEFISGEFSLYINGLLAMSVMLDTKHFTYDSNMVIGAGYDKRTWTGELAEISVQAQDIKGETRETTL